MDHDTPHQQIDLANGIVTVAGEQILDVHTAKLLKRVRERAVQASIARVPYLHTRLREYAIAKYYYEQNLSYSEIATKPDVNLTVNGVIKALWRLRNPLIDPSDIKNHVEASLRNHEHVTDLALELYDTKHPLASLGALQTVLKSEKGKRDLLGLDAPKNLRLSTGAGVFGMLANSEPLDPEQLKAIQALDPIIRPANAPVETSATELMDVVEDEPTAAEPPPIDEVAEPTNTNGRNGHKPFRIQVD